MRKLTAPWWALAAAHAALNPIAALRAIYRDAIVAQACRGIPRPWDLGDRWRS